MAEIQIFQVRRTVDYIVTQNFAVAATSEEQAEERLEAFMDSDWSADAAQQLQLVQLSDQLEQKGPSQKIECIDEAIDGGELTIDPSLPRERAQGKGPDMLALLREIASSHVMFLANTKDLGMKVKDFVDAFDAEMAVPQAALDAIVKLAPEVESDEVV